VNLAEVARYELKEWLGFSEDSPWGRGRIENYWRTIRAPFPGVVAPWSAVFVAALADAVNNGALARTASHIGYVRAALRMKLDNKPGFWAFDPLTTSPEVGDIVVRSRGTTRTTWADIAPGVGGFRESHGDIVVGRSGRAIQAIGGNAGSADNPQGVQERTYPLDEDGFLVGDRWMAVLKLSAPDEDRTPVQGAGLGLTVPLSSQSSAQVRLGLEHIKSVVNRLLLTL